MVADLAVGVIVMVEGELLQCLQGMCCVVQPEGSAVVGAHSLVVLHDDDR
jgi:hypothetical protein